MLSMLTCESQCTHVNQIVCHNADCAHDGKEISNIFHVYTYSSCGSSKTFTLNWYVMLGITGGAHFKIFSQDFYFIFLFFSDSLYFIFGLI